jgi:phosphoserine phosphatase RsbU/P
MLSDVVFSTSFMIGPFVASAFVSARRTAIVGGYAVLAATVVGVRGDMFLAGQHVLRITLVAAGAVIAVMLAAERERRDATLARVTRVAEAAQLAILRPVPANVGAVAVATRYRSAATEARVGGDLYEVVDTPFGVRAVVGDVRGKGLDAVRLAAVVLGSFREAAFRTEDLRSVVLQMNDSVERHRGDDEEFVTALVLEIDGPMLRVVDCGHHRPLLAAGDGGAVTPLGPPLSDLPLGMRPAPTVHDHRLEPGARILCFTDGVVEARDGDGRFFDLIAAVDRCIGESSPGAVLDCVLHRLQAHAGSALVDDAALVLLAPG